MEVARPGPYSRPTMDCNICARRPALNGSYCGHCGAYIVDLLERWQRAKPIQDAEMVCLPSAVEAVKVTLRAFGRGQIPVVGNPDLAVGDVYMRARKR